MRSSIRFTQPQTQRVSSVLFAESFARRILFTTPPSIQLRLIQRETQYRET